MNQFQPLTCPQDLFPRCCGYEIAFLDFCNFISLLQMMKANKNLSLCFLVRFIKICIKYFAFLSVFMQETSCFNAFYYLKPSSELISFAIIALQPQFRMLNLNLSSFVSTNANILDIILLKILINKL